MTLALRISNDQLTLEELGKLLRFLDNSYTPPLHQQVALDEYALKLYECAELLYLVHGDQLIGLIAFYPNAGKCYVSSFGIHYKYHDQGLGKLLFNHFLNEIKQRKIETISLSVHTINTQAISFYKKQGFQTVSVEKQKILLHKAVCS